MWITLNIYLALYIFMQCQGKAWNSKRDVQLFGLKFKNPANMGTMTASGTSSGSSAHQKNPANFAATLTGPAGSQQNYVNTGVNTGHQAPGDMTASLDQVHSKYGSQGGFVQHQNHQKPGFNTVTAGNNQQNFPGKCVNSHPDKCPLACQEVDSVTGCVVCTGTCQSGKVAGMTTSGPTTTTKSTTSAVKLPGVCPPFQANCPRGSFAIQNGCPVCTAAQSTNAPTTSVKPTTQAPLTCAPVRCVAPCNKGVKFDSRRCPVCVC